MRHQVWGKVLQRTYEQYEAVLRRNFAELALGVQWKDSRPVEQVGGAALESTKKDLAVSKFETAVHKAKVNKAKAKAEAKEQAARRAESEGDKARDAVKLKSREVTALLDKMELEQEAETVQTI